MSLAQLPDPLPFAAGTWELSQDAFWREDSFSPENVIKELLEKQLFFFDTAARYGHGYGEQLLSKMRRRYGQLQISSKAPFINLKQFENAFYASYKRLGEEPLSLYMLHYPPQRDEELEKAFSFLLRRKEEGLIAGIGLCNSARTLSLPFDVLQLPFSPLFPFYSERELPRCKIMLYGVLGHGLLLENGAIKKQELSRFVFWPQWKREREDILSNAAGLARVTSRSLPELYIQYARALFPRATITIGSRSAAHLFECARICSGAPLERGLVEQLTQIFSAFRNQSAENPWGLSF